MHKYLAALGLVLGLVSGYLVYSYVSGVRESASGVQLIRIADGAHLTPGTVIQPEFLAAIGVPVTFQSLTKIAVPARDVGWIVGKTVQRELGPGDLLMYSDIEDLAAIDTAELIPPGMRAFSVAADGVSAVGRLLRPSDRVDVIATIRTEADGPEDETETRTILENVKIIAIGQATRREQINRGTGAYGLVTLAVTPEQAHKLRFAMLHSDDDLIFTLRNPIDSADTNPQAVGWENFDRIR